MGALELQVLLLSHLAWKPLSFLLECAFLLSLSLSHSIKLPLLEISVSHQILCSGYLGPEILISESSETTHW
jgi:hypothetical protein